MALAPHSDFHFTKVHLLHTAIDAASIMCRSSETPTLFMHYFFFLGYQNGKSRILLRRLPWYEMHGSCTLLIPEIFNGLMM